ncbi:MAG: hypothetical protein NTY04_00540 [Candidatus Staskawiczbacteria bacterium]|nr:hypothetical protein [Candidatus Staskawiczbacteria bacterium]
MKTKEKISIGEFDGKRFQIRLVEPKDEKKAVLTHYLHNIHRTKTLQTMDRQATTERTPAPNS